MLKNNNLSYTSQNHSSVTILKHFVYRWQMNKTAENGEPFQSRCDLDLDRTMPNVKLVQAIFIHYIQYVQFSNGLNHFLNYCVHRQRHRHTMKTL